MRAAVINANAELQKLQTTDKDIKKKREQAMSQMQMQVSKAQRTLSDLKSAAATCKHNRDNTQGDLKSTDAEVNSLNEQKLLCERNIEKITIEVRNLEQQVRNKLLYYKIAVSYII